MAATVGPNARKTTAPQGKISVASAKEETIMISQFDKVMFETFGKDSAVIPAGEQHNLPLDAIPIYKSTTLSRASCRQTVH